MRDFDNTPCICIECGLEMAADERQLFFTAEIVHPNSKTDYLCPFCGGDTKIKEEDEGESVY